MSGPLPNWLNWWGLIATIAGLFVSLVGLIATYGQARAAKRAAVAAREAAIEAISRLQNRSLMSNLASSIERIQIIRSHTLAGEIIAARSLFEICSKDIREIFFNLDFPDEESISVDIDITLKQISLTLDNDQITTSKKSSIMKALREISDMMSTQYAKRQWAER